MVQFKDVFTGKEHAPLQARDARARSASASAASTTTSRTSASPRGTTRSSRCSATSRFGDYFKEDAIAFAWELLTKVYGVPTDAPGRHRLRRRGGRPGRRRGARHLDARSPASATTASSASGMSDNFWQMGDTGPCGPCTEIHFFHGDGDGRRRRASARSRRPTASGWMEIWNLVFMQFERADEGRPRLDAAPRAVRRHRHGPRAHRERPPGRDDATTTPTSCARSSRRPREISGKRYRGTQARRRRLDARHRRPRAHDGVPDRRGRLARPRRSASTCSAA